MRVFDMDAWEAEMDAAHRRELAEARRDALLEAADAIYEVGGTSAGVPVWRWQVEDWLRDRAQECIDKPSKDGEDD